MDSILKKPIKLTSTRAWRTYSGGKLIDEMYNVAEAIDTNFPEEWIASCVRARNKGREHILDEGLSYIEGKNIKLKEVMDSNPVAFLGEEHYKKHGASMAVLAKIIDSSERLTIQCHPTKEKAMKYFNSEFGKTESWYIMGGREIDGVKPCIYLGFKEDITREYFIECFERQDLDELLNCLHKIEVEKGDVFLIEGGIPHAIGSGCFLMEVQEPTDYTIRVEKTTPSGLVIKDEMCHQGVGFDSMFDFFNFDRYTKDEILNRWKIKDSLVKNSSEYIEYDLIKPTDTACFSMKKVEIKEKYITENRDTHYVIKVVGGQGILKYEDYTSTITIGSEFLIPACVDEVLFLGNNLEIIIYYPPV